MSPKDQLLTLDKYREFVDLIDLCMDDYLYILDIERDIYYISEKVMDRFATPSNMISDTANVFRSFIHPDDFDWVMDDISKLVSGEKDSHCLDYRWIGRDGSPIWINCRGRSVKNSEGKPVFMVGCVDEIGKKQRADNISGLMEISTIREHPDSLFTNAEEGYCLHIGIDAFRAINDRFGVDYGDFILRSVAESIASALSPGQEVYRVVGDEYIVISHTGTPEKDAAALYRQICRNSDAFVAQNHYEAVFTLSAGAVPAKDLLHLPYTQLLKMTQFSLSEAKARGKNQIYFFKDEDYRGFVRRRELLRLIRESVAAGFEGFEAYYQPIMRRSEDTPYAAEALLRYHMKSGETISPLEFIPILEESGLIIPVGKWVMNEAMEFCSFMRKSLPSFRVNVNVSYIQVTKGAFLEDFFLLLKEHEMDPSGIVIELTESGYVGPSPQMQDLWNALKQHGVSIALDDFGSGYSNLLYISQMMPHVVKLDRSFTVKAMENAFEMMLMSSTIQMVHSLGLILCVEGVETEEDLARVRELRADCIQGFYFSKPCPKKEFIEKYL